MEAKEIVSWTLVLITALILALIIQRVLTPAAAYDPQIESCAQQIIASSKLSALTQGDEARGIHCPTQRKTITGSDEEQKDQLAQEMVSCYDLWGGGDTILFDEDGVFCHVCSISSFETEEPLTGLAYYMETHPENNPYMQQILPIQNEEFKAPPSNEDVIDRTKERATIFYYARGDEKIKLAGEALFSENSLKTSGIIGGTMLTQAGAYFVIKRTIGAAAGVACGVPSFSIGAAPCAIGATIVVEAAFIVTSSFTAFFVDTFTDDPPEYASFIIQRDWEYEDIRQLGCEVSFANS